MSISVNPSHRKMLKLLDNALELCEDAYEDGQEFLSYGLLNSLNSYVKLIEPEGLAAKVGEPIFMAADEIFLLQERFIIVWKKPKRKYQNYSQTSKVN